MKIHSLLLRCLFYPVGYFVIILEKDSKHLISVDVYFLSKKNIYIGLVVFLAFEIFIKGNWMVQISIGHQIRNTYVEKRGLCVKRK